MCDSLWLSCRDYDRALLIKSRQDRPLKLISWNRSMKLCFQEQLVIYRARHKSRQYLLVVIRLNCSACGSIALCQTLQFLFKNEISDQILNLLSRHRPSNSQETQLGRMTTLLHPTRHQRCMSSQRRRSVTVWQSTGGSRLYAFGMLFAVSLPVI